MLRHPHVYSLMMLTLLAMIWLAPPAVAQGPRQIILPSRGAEHGMCPVFTPDSKHLLWWDGKGIAIWDTKQEKVVGTIDQAYWTFVLSCDGTRVATDMKVVDANGQKQDVIKIYDVASRKEIQQLNRPAGGNGKDPCFRTCGFDPRAEKIFTRTEVDLQVWDVKSGKLLHHIARPNPPHNNGSAQSPDGQYLTIEDGHAAVHILDTRAEKFISIQPSTKDFGAILGKPNGGYVSSFGSWSFSGDGKILHGTCQLNGMLLYWSASDGKMLGGLKIPNLLFAKVSPDGTLILASYGGNDRQTVRVLDGKTKGILHTLGPMQRDACWYTISPDNRWVFVSSVGDTRLWELPAAPAPGPGGPEKN